MYLAHHQIVLIYFILKVHQEMVCLDELDQVIVDVGVSLPVFCLSCRLENQSLQQMDTEPILAAVELQRQS